MSRSKILITFGILLVLVFLIVGLILALSAQKKARITIDGDEEKTAVANDIVVADSTDTKNNSADSQIKNKTMSVVKITTNKGEISIELFASDAPKTVENFVTLAKKGFYNGVIFHRVISGFMIQGGDPTGTGMGGPGYKFADELNPQTESYRTGYVRGTVAMANSGPNTNGSQFFIMHTDYPLPHNYTIFGKVISGLEVVDAIATSKTDSSDRPIEKIVMEKVEVFE